MPVPTQHSPKTILVTGGCGFIGSNFVRWVLKRNPSVNIVNIDALTYAGNPDNLADCVAAFGNRYTFVKGSITDRALLEQLFKVHDFDTVVHLAAESHVDRSIDGPADFIQTNIVGTYELLEVCRSFWSNRSDVRFHHVSTDEVFGSLGDDGFFRETTPYDPSSPYSASKASADHLVRAWHHTFGLPVTISNCSNNYGPYQFPEKLIPLMIQKAYKEDSLPVYGTGENVRDWLHVEDHCSAIYRVLSCGRLGETYLIGGNAERTNLDVVDMLCTVMDEVRPRSGNKSHRELITFVTDRPGHDFRYAIDASKIRNELGWSPSYSFDVGLRHTVAWYLESLDEHSNSEAQAYAGERLGILAPAK